MNMLEVHAEARDRSNTAYHEFLLYYRNDAAIVYGFVEGKNDPMFYRGLIEQLLDDGWTVRLIMAGDKRRVIENVMQMDWTRFPEKRVCFFVDRDLSDYLGDAIPQRQNLYVTDGYSVETWIVNESTLERALEELLGIQGMSPTESESIRQIFRSSFGSFQEAMMPIMGQILLWRRLKKDPCLENIRLGAWFSFQNGSLQFSSGCSGDSDRLKKAGEWCKLACADEAEVLAAVNELLEKCVAEKVVRGKYALWFFVHCILSIRDGIGKFCDKYKFKPPKARVTMGVENAMVLLANRVRIPQSLRTFIQRNYLEYIQGIPG